MLRLRLQVSCFGYARLARERARVAIFLAVLAPFNINNNLDSIFLARLPNQGRQGRHSASREPDTGVYDLGNQWFAERALLYEKFAVIHATIAIHFHPSLSKPA
jgi:hypothetical protein